jgi:hypothetical protein
MIGRSHKLANGASCCLLHRDSLCLSPHPQRGFFVIGESQRHGHAKKSSTLTPRRSLRGVAREISRAEFALVRFIGLFLLDTK